MTKALGYAGKHSFNHVAFGLATAAGAKLAMRTAA